MPAARSKRYNSEYSSHYKSFEAKRPHTVKGELTRSLSYDDVHSISSTPRAGVASSNVGIIHEPPLQRKKIVPYEKNHNIFKTVTLKEVPEKKWLHNDDGSTTETHTSPVRRQHKSRKGERSGERPSRALERGETPILAAEREVFSSPPKGKPRSYPYISDRIMRKSTYKKDFPDYRQHSKSRESRSQKQHSSKQRSKSVGGKPTTRSGLSPDRLPPAGIRTETSLGDPRLLQPSDNSNYMRSPEGHGTKKSSSTTNKVYDSEYNSHYRQPTKYMDGTWIEKAATQDTQHENHGKWDAEWFKQAIERRNKAYGYSHRSRGTHFSRENLDEMNREQAREDEEESPGSERLLGHSEDHNIKSYKDKSSSQAAHKPPRKREAWTHTRPRSPTDSDVSRLSYATDKAHSEDDDDLFIERGRSPTPELREVGQSRRHHLDLTTNILNDRLKKSLTLSETKETSVQRKHRERKETGKREGGNERRSPPSSIADRASDAGSYVPPRDDDVMSESAVSSRASVASETLERARKRRDEFWRGK